MSAKPEPKFQTDQIGPAVRVVDKCYANEGNRAVLEILGSEPKVVLDVGCGAGDNARLARQMGLKHDFYGITLSEAERKIASQVLTDCWVEDLETSDLQCLAGRKFDVLLFSHVLEHLRDPASVISKCVRFLTPNGIVVIAVPNVMVLRQRLAFLRGRFEYEEDGVMDSTHLRFFSYDSADRYLLEKVTQLEVVSKVVEGSVPLWLLRHHLLSKKMKAWLDRVGCKALPNLFGWQILITARRKVIATNMSSTVHND